MSVDLGRDLDSLKMSGINRTAPVANQGLKNSEQLIIAVRKIQSIFPPPHCLEAFMIVTLYESTTHRKYRPTAFSGIEYACYLPGEADI